MLLLSLSLPVRYSKQTIHWPFLKYFQNCQKQNECWIEDWLTIHARNIHILCYIGMYHVKQKIFVCWHVITPTWMNTAPLCPVNRQNCKTSFLYRSPNELCFNKQIWINYYCLFCVVAKHIQMYRVQTDSVRAFTKREWLQKCGIFGFV